MARASDTGALDEGEGLMSDPVTRLNAALEGRYHIESGLGEGGMATVYLADDLKHERKVALKVLKPELAAVVGAERFLAEIKTTADLQHPHILPLFDSGEAGGFVFYVMPYVEGESLRQRLDREHQLPVDDAVRIASDVAEALEYAHGQGVIHRDIKPANILIHAGRPVIADFGIALAVSAGGGHRLTETGLSVGTPHYMSPEQATGDQHVGTATDTYALGCVLYEMLVGEPPYTGSTAQAILGKIIAGELASATKERASVPENVDAAIKKALEKLPADRFTGAQDFAGALSDAGFRHGDLAKGGSAGAGPWSRLTIAFAALSVLAPAVAAWSFLGPEPPEPPEPVARFASPFEEGQRPTGYMQFTPDGSALVYTGVGASGLQLWIRRWADLSATPIRGTEGVVNFALSPDGREVAFSQRPGPLRVVPLDGGPGRTLVEQVRGVHDWSAEAMVYFQGLEDTRLRRVPASGGDDAVEILSELQERETRHSSFQALPEGRMGVFQVYYAQNAEDAEVWAIDLVTRERRFLTVGQNPKYASTGHLLFGTPDGTLMAAPIDPRTAALTGRAAPVAEGLSRGANFGTMSYAVSETGALAYTSGNAQRSPANTELVWVTRTGDVTPVDPGGWVFRRGANYGWRLSPDGTRIALTSEVDGNGDVWIKELPDGPVERLTFDTMEELYPAWTPDGEYVTYSRNNGAEDPDLWRSRADRSGVPERLADDEQILGQPGSETDPALSPNGRWLAYSSDATGRPEVFVRPFLNADAPGLRVSTDGGVGPLWAHSGRELFFIDTDRQMIAVEVETDPTFQVVEMRTLFTLQPGYFIDVGEDFYDISADDQRFLMGRSFFLSEEGNRVILFLGFSEELKRLVPN